MKWPIEPIYEVTKKLEKSWFLLWILTVSLIFVEFLGCQKWQKNLLLYIVTKWQMQNTSYAIP